MNKKRFELDLTNAEVPDWWGSLPKVIPLVIGSFNCDFDIASQEINKIADPIIRKRTPGVLFNSGIPIGFDASCIPVGAVIRRLPDVETK